MKPLKLTPYLTRLLRLTLNPPCQVQPKTPAKVGISVHGLGNAFFAQIQRLKAAKITVVAKAG